MKFIASLTSAGYRRLAAVIALTLWVSSLFLPTIQTHCPPRNFESTGWVILWIGWMGPLTLQFGWFANPLILGMIFYLLAGRRVNFAVAIVCLCLALDSFLLEDIPKDVGSDHVCERDIGFYLWIACSMALAAAAFADWVNVADKPSGKRAPPQARS